MFEVQAGGDDSFGGGYVTGASGVDYSTTAPTAAQATLSASSVVNATTTKITVAGGDYTVHANDIGNIFRLTSGTATAGAYQITAVDTGANTWTLDRSVGTAGQTCIGKMGGALATPGLAASLATVAGNLIYVKSGTYTMSTATPGSGGPVLFASAIRVAMIGYQTTRGDDTGTRPSLDWGAVAAPGSTSYLFSGQGNASQVFHNLQADGNTVSNVSGFNVSNTRWAAIGCKAIDCNQASQVGFLGGGSTRPVVQCSAVNCTIGFSTLPTVLCVADSCGVGFSTTTSFAYAVSCIAFDCTGDGFAIEINGGLLMNCLAYSNDGDGFSAASVVASYVNCASVLNGGYGWNAGAVMSALWNCADYNNTSGRVNGTNYHLDHDSITMTGDPFDGAASDDFRPDNTASQGALLRDAGLPVYGQTDNRDVGAVQHADGVAGGGLLNYPGLNGRING